MHKKRIIPWLASALVTLAVSGCNGGSADTGQPSEPKAKINAKFAATYLQTLSADTEQDVPVAYSSIPESRGVVTKSFKLDKDLHYNGILRITNLDNPDDIKDYDWPVTQREDGTVSSHRALSLKKGVYNFLLILERNGQQYLAESLGQDIKDNEQPNLEFVLKPNLGQTITDLDKVGYITNLKFAFSADELADLVEPQFGLKINNEKEEVFLINKETGLSEALLNVVPGQYKMELKLYDGDLLVGKNENDTTLDIMEGSDAKMDVIPLQADVTIKLDEIKDQGYFKFNIPHDVIAEVEDESKIALIVRLSANSTDTLIDEKVLTIVAQGDGSYSAADMFTTAGETSVTASLSFHHVDQADADYSKVPFAQCLSSVNVELNQKMGCRLSLHRKGVITGNIKGTVHFNVIDTQLQSADGVKIYLDNKLAGITGKDYNQGSLKLHLVAGEYKVKAIQGVTVAAETITVKPLDVLNPLMYLKRNSDLGTGNFVSNHTIPSLRYVDPNSVASGDINGDGKVDLVMGGHRGYQLAINDGSGKFVYRAHKESSSSYRQVALGDVDSDGDLDFVLAVADQSAPVKFYLNNGKGEFSEGQHITIGETMNAAKLADIDGDHDLDLILASQTADMAYVFTNDGNGHFAEIQQLDAKINYQFGTVALGDMDNDGDMDIVLAESGTYAAGLLFLNDGKGGYSQQEYSQQEYAGDEDSSVSATSVALGDVDNDGDLDVLVTDYKHSNRLFINDGKLGFIQSKSFFSVQGLKGVFSDIDSDGDLDALLMNEDKTVITYSNDGAGNFSILERTISETDFDNRLDDILATDIDGDGDEDLIVLGYKRGTSESVDGRVYLNQPH